MTHWEETIAEMEEAVIFTLQYLEKGEGFYKLAIAEETGIPLDVLTVLLKRLKIAGIVRMIQFFNDGLCAGSGYCLTEKGRGV